MKFSHCLKSTPLLIALITTSCSLFTPNKDSQLAVKQAIETPESWAEKTEQYRDTSIEWLETFNDPMMLKLIAEGKSNNFDLQVAAANMDIAWLLAKQSGAELEPIVDLSLGRDDSGGISGDPSIGNWNIGLQLSWELDVWGRIRAGVDAAKVSAQATEADYLFAQYSLSANIAKNYLVLIH